MSRLPINLVILPGLLLGTLLVPDLATAQGDRGMITTLPADVTGPVTVLSPDGPIPPSHVFPDHFYSTGGTSLRNQSQGNIQLSGNGTPPPAATECFVYWAVIVDSDPFGEVPGPAACDPEKFKLHVQKRDPEKSRTVVLPGALIGFGPDPCWPGDTICVFKAPLPLDVCNAGGGHAGVFRAAISCASASSCLGEDPWGAALGSPLWEGASIVAVWPSPGLTTSIFDVGLAGATFFGVPGLAYALALPVAPTGTLFLDNIGADGQHGASRLAIASVSDEVSTVCGVPVAGPGSPYNDSDWNGNDSNPIPSLWDTTGHELECTLPVVPVSFVSASGGSPTDCLTPVANIVAQ